ncbi:MAG: sigma-70 family RNA polymerase sigma factor [Actinobacteria bacterium]|nr:sigma-70 family RNA polymerase sigma factor [Actinomycetota bacterium]
MEKALDFQAFYSAQYQRVFKAIYLSGGDPELAHDITQEAFKLAFVRWRRLSRHEWAGGWVMTTALNLLRKERRRPQEVHLDPVKHDSRTRLGESDQDLQNALRKLPVRQRTAILLYYLADLPVPAVAQMMGVAEGTVKASLSQARSKLQQALADKP